MCVIDQHPAGLWICLYSGKALRQRKSYARLKVMAETGFCEFAQIEALIRAFDSA